MTEDMKSVAPVMLGLVCLWTLLAACDTAQPPPNAPHSAVVETRDGPSAAELAAKTQVVLLGTGTPIPHPDRAGASVAIVHKGEAYLFDVGPGAVRNATRARYRYDIPSLYSNQICCVFITHMHSDHTLDLPELAFALWWRRDKPLRAWGPIGMEAMAEGMYRMMGPDISLRTGGAQPARNPSGYRVDVTEIESGIVFEQDDLVVEAFPVDHGDIRPAFGYRVTTDSLSVVISGDTAYSERLVEKARGVDILIHEVISDRGLLRAEPRFQAYHKRSHTTVTELARLANEARPELLVLYHALFYGIPEAAILDEIGALYDGAVVLADDLDRF